MGMKKKESKPKFLVWETSTMQTLANSIMGIRASYFVNKFLLECRPIHLHAVYGSFQATMGELKSQDRDYMAHKAWNIYYQAFKKTFADLQQL